MFLGKRKTPYCLVLLLCSSLLGAENVKPSLVKEASAEETSPDNEKANTVEKVEIQKLEGTTIIGNTEFPKIIYELPWKKPLLKKTAVLPPPPKGLPLVYLDRERLLKKLQWHTKVLQKKRIKNREKQD